VPTPYVRHSTDCTCCDFGHLRFNIIIWARGPGGRGGGVQGHGVLCPLPRDPAPLGLPKFRHFADFHFCDLNCFYRISVFGFFHKCFTNFPLALLLPHPPPLPLDLPFSTYGGRARGRGFWDVFDKRPDISSFFQILDIIPFYGQGVYTIPNANPDLDAEAVQQVYPITTKGQK
jgi:hypothetical protein